MAAFTLDTAGVVCVMPATDHENPEFYQWHDIAALPYGQLAQGYIEALWREPLHDDDAEAAALGLTLAGLKKAFHHLAPETLALILKDCERFARSSVYRECRQSENDPPDERWMGRGLWHGRQRSGVGFGFLDCCWEFDTQLVAEAERFPPVTLSVGEDGLIYQREASRG